MTNAGSVHVNIGGDVSGQIAIGNNNMQIQNYGGVVNVIKPSSRIPFKKRAIPIQRRPRPFPVLLDRMSESLVVQSSLQGAISMSVFGENGVGKTTFLSHMAHLPETNNFSDGVVYLYLRHEGFDDLLQMLFEAFYSSTGNIMPTAGQLRHSLQSIKAVILLDDLMLAREDTQALITVMPLSCFIFASLERSLWGNGKIILLGGLPEQERIELFEKELGRSLSEAEKTDVRLICGHLHGNPLKIIQTASLITSTGKTISEIKKQFQNDPDPLVLEKELFNGLGESQQKTLAILGASGGTLVPLGIIGSFLNLTNAQYVLKSLIDKGLVWNQGFSYGLVGGLGDQLGRLWNLSSWEDALINYFANWLTQQPSDMLIEDASDLLIKVTQKAGEKNRWPEVIRIGRAVERILILRKRWQAWLDILNLILKAAQTYGDRSTEAWALHQLGSRALCLNYANQARQFLTQALNIRQALGDKAGAAVTQHNLSVLPGSHVPVKNSSSNGIGRYVAYAVGGAVGMGLLGVIALFLLLNLPDLRPSPAPSQTSVVPNTSTIAFIPSASFTPIVIFPPTGTYTLTLTPSLTPSITPSFTLTSSITPTDTPTQTPFVIITTPVPKDVVLYDFVTQADKADWEAGCEGDDVGPPCFNELVFFEEPKLPSPENYVNISDKAYAGWEKNPALEDKSVEATVILAYPQGLYPIRGRYNLSGLQLRFGDYISARVGFKNPSDAGIIHKPDGVTFQIYFYEKDLQKAELLTYLFDSLDGKAHDLLIQIPKSLDGKSGWFILAVESGNNSDLDWSVWMDAALIGLPR